MAPHSHRAFPSQEGMMESLQDAFRENLDRIVATVVCA